MSASRTAPACWPATLVSRWGAPGEDLAVRRPPEGKRGACPDPGRGPGGLCPVLEELPMSNAWSFETRQIHAGQEPDSATGARCPAHLPDDVVRLPQRRKRRQPLRPRRTCADLHPDRQPHPGRRGAAGGEPGGRTRGAAAQLRPGRGDVRDPEHRRGRRPRGGQPQPVRRHLQPAGPHAEEVRHLRDVRGGPGQPGAVARRRPAQHQAVLRRGGLQPAPGRPGHRGHLAGGARGRRAADRGQHALHART